MLKAIVRSLRFRPSETRIGIAREDRARGYIVCHMNQDVVRQACCGVCGHQYKDPASIAATPGDQRSPCEVRVAPRGLRSERVRQGHDEREHDGVQASWKQRGSNTRS
jgi:hypothetical protein